MNEFPRVGLFARRRGAAVERDESGNWIASVPSLRGVHTHARTLAGLRRYLQDAIALWLEVDHLDAGERDPHIDRESIHVELQVKLAAHGGTPRRRDGSLPPRAGTQRRD